MRRQPRDHARGGGVARSFTPRSPAHPRSPTQEKGKGGLDIRFVEIDNPLSTE